METDPFQALSEIAGRGGTAYVRNLAAAEAAVTAGMFNLAKVLRAVGHSRRVMATRAARALVGEVDARRLLEANQRDLDRGGSINLASADRAGQVALQAERQKLTEVEAQVQDILARALESLAQHPDVSEHDVAQVIWGCYGCGNLMEGEAPDACSVAGALSAEFEWFGPFYSSTPEHLGSLSPDEIIATLARIPTDVERLLGEADDADLGQRPAEDEWSVKEIVGHVIEVEALFNQRLDFILGGGEGGDLSSPVPPWKLQDGKGYEALPKAELLDRLAASRQATLDSLRGLQPSAWTVSGGIQGGRLSVLELAVWLTNHDVGHVAQIKRYVPGGGYQEPVQARGA